MARGRSRKRGGGRGRGQKNEGMSEVRAVGEGAGVSDNEIVNPPPIPIDLSLVKKEAVEDDEYGVLGIKQEPGERGGGARLVDMLENQLDTESTKKTPRRRSNTPSAPTPEPTRKSSRIKERLSQRSNEPTPRPPSPPKRTRRPRSKPVTPAPPQLTMMDVKKEPIDSDEEERYDISRVKLEVCTPPHEPEVMGNDNALVSIPMVEKGVLKVKKPLIKPPVLKLNRSVGVGVTVTVEKDGKEEVGVVVEGVEEPDDPDMITVTKYTPLTSVLREKYYVVDPDKDKAVFEKPLGFMVKSALMGYHDLATNKLPKLTRKMTLQAAHSHALASSLSEKHQLQKELENQNKKYRTDNSTLDLVSERERQRAEDAWQKLDRTMLHSKTYEEGQAQQHFLGKRFTDAVDNIKAACDKRLKDLEMDRGKLAKENEALVRGKEAFQKKWRKVNGRVSELEGVVDELKTVVGGLMSVLAQQSGKNGKDIEDLAVGVFGGVVKGCFEVRGDGVTELRGDIFGGGKKDVPCPFDSTGIQVGNIVEVEVESDQEEFVEVEEDEDEGKAFDGGMYSGLEGEDVSMVVENFGGVTDGLEGFLDVIGGGGDNVGEPDKSVGMGVDLDVGGGSDQIVFVDDGGVGEEGTSEPVGGPSFDDDTEWWLQVVVKDPQVGSETLAADSTHREPEITCNLVKIPEHGGEQVGGNVPVVGDVEGKIVDQEVVNETSVADELDVKEPSVDDKVVEKEAPVVDQEVVKEALVVDKVVVKEPAVVDETVVEESEVVHQQIVKEPQVVDEENVEEPQVLDQVVVKEPLIVDQQVVKETPVADQEVAKEPPVVDQDVVKETPVVNQVVAKEPPIVDQQVVKETPVVNQVVAKEPPIVDQQVVKETPVVNQVVAKETLVVDQVVAKEPPVVDQQVVKETLVVDQEVVKELPVVNQDIVKEPQVVEQKVVKDTPVVDQEVVKEPPIVDQVVIKEPPIVDQVVVKEPSFNNQVVSKEPQLADKAVVKEPPIVDQVIAKQPPVAKVITKPQVTDQQVARNNLHTVPAKPPQSTDDQVTNKPIVTELHPGVVITSLPNQSILFNGRRGYEPGETISDWPDDPTDNSETTPTHLFDSRGTKRKQERRDRGRERKVRKVNDSPPQETVKIDQDVSVRDRLSKQLGDILPVTELGGKCEKRKLEDQVKKGKGQKNVGKKKKVENVKNERKGKVNLMAELFGEEDVDEREGGGEYDFGSGSSGDSVFSDLAKDLDLSSSDEEEGEGVSLVMQREMEDLQSKIETLVLSPLHTITTENTAVIIPLVNLLKRFPNPAQPFYTMMIDSTEDDLNQDLKLGEKTSPAPLVPRFRHILACIVQITKLTTEYKDFWKSVLEYLGNVIRDDSKRDIEDEFLIKSIGRLVGAICYEFKGDREGVGIVMDVCLCRGPFCYAFAYGAFCSYSDMLGWSKDVMGFEDLRVESKGLVWYFCRNVKWGDASASRAVIDFLRVGLVVPVPQESLVEFLRVIVGEVKGGGKGGDYAKVISLVCVGLGVGWFEKSFCGVFFDGWLKEFGEGGISGEKFKVLVDGMGMAAVTFRRDELPVDLKCVTARLDIICRLQNMPDDIIVIANDYQGQIAMLKLRDPGDPIDGWGEYSKKSATKETKCFGKKKKNKKRCEGRRGGSSQGPMVPVPLQGSSSVVGRPALLPTPERSPPVAGGGWVRGSSEVMQQREWRGKGGAVWKGPGRGEGRGGAAGRGEARGGARGRGEGRGGAAGRGEGRGGRGGARGRGEVPGRGRGRGGRETRGGRGQRGQRGY